MYLLIDVGNSRIKWQCVTGSYNDETQSCHGLLSDLGSFINTLNTAEVNVLLAAVNQTCELQALLSSYCFKSIKRIFSESEQLGLKNSYTHPERMGVDRWLAMIAAYTLIKDRAELKGIIVVDAGSALTIDVVSVNGLHEGGYIVPGLLMAQNALFANTEQVIQYNEPIVGSTRDKLSLGNNTAQCVEFGVINQMVALVRFVQEEYLDYEIFFTGGDCEILAGYLNAGTVDKDLVLKGLWQVRN